MLKKLLLALTVFFFFTGLAFAEVEINKADQASLDSVKGIGPKMSKTILDERKKGGDFKDWSDLENRVKGIREKKAAKLSEAGLIVNGKPFRNAAGTDKPATKGGKAAKEAAKEAKRA